MYCEKIEFKRGDSLSLYWEVSDGPGKPRDITGWQFFAQLYKGKDKIADFVCDVQNAGQGLVRLSILDTSGFPLGDLSFDVVMVLPDPAGFTITSPTARVSCVARMTQL